MGKYRRRLNSDVWHFNKNCRWYPTMFSPHKSSSSKPKTGEFCNECLAKDRKKSQ